MTSIAQRVFYLEKEATPGGGTVVDTALRVTECSLKAVVDKRQPNEFIGSFAQNRHYIGSKHGEGGITIDSYYQHLPVPISMALGAGTAVLSGTPEIWTFAWPNATAPTFATYYCEYSDGGSGIVACPDVFATDIEISGEAGGSWMINPALVGGNVTYPAALTASPTPTASPRAVLMAETTFWMTDNYADLGSQGQVSAALISFSWKLEGLQHAKLFAGSLYPNGRGNNKTQITLEVVVEAAVATVETMKDRHLNSTLTAVGIRSLAEDAGGANIDWYINIDGMYYLSDVSPLDERDGNNTWTFTFIAQRDASGNTGEIEIGCDLQAL